MSKKISHQKLKYLLLIFITILNTLPLPTVKATSCPDLKIIFARGSGGELNNSPDYLAFKSALDSKLKTTRLSYEFLDLDYPAVPIGFNHLETSLGALVGSGDAYAFGDSVTNGSQKLTDLVNSTCPNTKFVVAGYSQGAMVVSKAINAINPDKIIYIATFGDPKLYLPEGQGLIPSACRNRHLSDYRAYVPDCHAYKGLLGAVIPYQPTKLTGKLGTWCNKNDLFCSSHFNLRDHVSYIADDLYEDAAKLIFSKITTAFNLKNHLTSPHDTAILIDSTGSMSYLIEQYKQEAFRLAKETLISGGRVALFEYRDLADPFTPVEHCNFETCTLEIFQQKLDSLEVDGGGDTPESLLSASLHVMKKLNWRYGATKSVITLTDAGFHSPDLDSTTFEEVVSLSRKIDPVNFYIVTTEENSEIYANLAFETDGKVVTKTAELSLLTDFIMERFDSLPKVEPTETPISRPTLTLTSTTKTSARSIKINFTTDADKTLVSVNDFVLGITTEQSLEITDLNPELENIISLSPIKNDTRGDSVILTLSPDTENNGHGSALNLSDQTPSSATKTIPKAPNTGTH